MEGTSSDGAMDADGARRGGLRADWKLSGDKMVKYAAGKLMGKGRLEGYITSTLSVAPDPLKLKMV